MGYSLLEQSDLLQFSYVDYNKSSAFEEGIRSIELLPENKIITIASYSFVRGGSSKEWNLNTLSIRFNVIGTGNTEVNQLLFHMHNGNDYIWDIGAVKLEVLEFPQYGHLKLGVRGFVSSHFDEYWFIINNETPDSARLISLEYSMPEGTLTHNLFASKAQTEGSVIEQTHPEIIAENESRLFRYSLEYKEHGECNFFVFKPLLSYELNGSSYTMPLDDCIYSGYFTEEVIALIKQNHYVQN